MAYARSLTLHVWLHDSSRTASSQSTKSSKNDDDRYVVLDTTETQDASYCSQVSCCGFLKSLIARREHFVRATKMLMFGGMEQQLQDRDTAVRHSSLSTITHC